MAKIRLAIVGPDDSVKLIQTVAQERDILSVLPIIYQDASEVPAIMSQMAAEADIWLFSGKVPYNYAVHVPAAKPILHIPHTGTSLYRALFDITYIHKLKIDQLSFDSFSRKEIEEAFADISMPLPVIYVNDYQGIVSAKAMADYHYELWRQGKIQVAVTCFLATFLELQQLGVPVFRIWPTRDNIRTMLDIAVSTCEAMRFKDSQIAIQHISIDKYEDIVRESMSSYAVRRVELRLYELLMDYSELVKGSIVIHGNGQYTIYSTRGIVEEVTQDFTIMPFLEEITRRVAVHVSGGIGLGQTAHQADENAHIALGLARGIGQGRWMVVKDDRSVAGPLNSQTHLTYSMRSDDAFYQEIARKLSVSATTVSKLVAAFSKLAGQAVGADDIALYLAITPRSARRLLNSLTEQGLARVAGEEAVARGRPRKLYEILVSQFNSLPD